MNAVELKTQVTELETQVKGFFNRKTEYQGRKDLERHCREVLEQIPHMEDLLPKYPVYGAIAFLGRFHFTDCTETRVLAVESSAAALRAIREKKAVRLNGNKEEESVWAYLRDTTPEVACAVLAICFLATKKPSIVRLINNQEN